ncbi:MAG: PDZ domain-containing protein, partial [Pseudomonadota bacterium]|nr:PDZ domain-containing protein [Pseudomonadota bacterium]
EGKRSSPTKMRSVGMLGRLSVTRRGLRREPQTVTIDGCLADGVGLGLDNENRVTFLRPGGPAAESGLLKVGDRVLSVDGVACRARRLHDVLQPAETHTFVVLRRTIGPLAASPAAPHAAPRVARERAISDGAAARAHTPATHAPRSAPGAPLGALDARPGSAPAARGPPVRWLYAGFEQRLE